VVQGFKKVKWWAMGFVLLGLLGLLTGEFALARGNAKNRIAPERFDAPEQKEGTGSDSENSSRGQGKARRSGSTLNTYGYSSHSSDDGRNSGNDKELVYQVRGAVDWVTSFNDEEINHGGTPRPCDSDSSGRRSSGENALGRSSSVSTIVLGSEGTVRPRTGRRKSSVVSKEQQEAARACFEKAMAKDKELQSAGEQLKAGQKPIAFVDGNCDSLIENTGGFLEVLKGEMGNWESNFKVEEQSLNQRIADLTDAESNCNLDQTGLLTEEAELKSRLNVLKSETSSLKNKNSQANRDKSVIVGIANDTHLKDGQVEVLARLFYLRNEQSIKQNHSETQANLSQNEGTRKELIEKMFPLFKEHLNLKGDLKAAICTPNSPKKGINLNGANLVKNLISVMYQKSKILGDGDKEWMYALGVGSGDFNAVFCPD